MRLESQSRSAPKKNPSSSGFIVRYAVEWAAVVFQLHFPPSTRVSNLALPLAYECKNKGIKRG